MFVECIAFRISDVMSTQYSAENDFQYAAEQVTQSVSFKHDEPMRGGLYKLVTKSWK